MLLSSAVSGRVNGAYSGVYSAASIVASLVGVIVINDKVSSSRLHAIDHAKQNCAQACPATCQYRTEMPQKNIKSFAIPHPIRTPFNININLSAQIRKAIQPLMWPRTLPLLHYMHKNFAKDIDHRVGCCRPLHAYMSLAGWCHQARVVKLLKKLIAL